MDEIRIWAAGIPQPGGSKRGFFNKKIGRVIITEDNAKSKPWRAVVAAAASEQMMAVLEGPLRVRFEFVFNRPKGHFNGSGLLKRSAPAFPSVRPDTTKLVRSAEDALKGIVWRDDSQVVTQFASKRYGDQAGALIVVRHEAK